MAIDALPWMVVSEVQPEIMTGNAETLIQAAAQLQFEEPPFPYKRAFISASVYYFRDCPKCGKEVPAVAAGQYRCIDCEDKKRHSDERKRNAAQEKAEQRIEH